MFQSTCHIGLVRVGTRRSAPPPRPPDLLLPAFCKAGAIAGSLSWGRDVKPCPGSRIRGHRPSLATSFRSEGELAQCMVRRLTAREKLRMKKVCVNVSGLFVERCLLAMMRYAAYLSFENARPCMGHFGKQVSGAPF